MQELQIQVVTLYIYILKKKMIENIISKEHTGIEIGAIIIGSIASLFVGINKEEMSIIGGMLAVL